MAEKQVVFRLEEELHRRLQMYALQKNETVKDLMEEVVKQLLRGGNGIRPRMLKMIHQKFRDEETKIKEVLKEACADSVRLSPSDKGSVIQVVINEDGEIRTLETQKGIVPMSVIDSKAYLLYEFDCVDVMDIYYQWEAFDVPDLIDPLKGRFKDFIQWLAKHGIIEEIEYENDVDEDYAEDVYTIYEEYFFKARGENHNPYLDFIYKWNPSVYHQLKKNIKGKMIDVYVDEKVKNAWNKEISLREELELNLEEWSNE